MQAPGNDHNFGGEKVFMLQISSFSFKLSFNIDKRLKLSESGSFQP